MLSYNYMRQVIYGKRLKFATHSLIKNYLCLITFTSCLTNAFAKTGKHCEPIYKTEIDLANKREPLLNSMEFEDFFMRYRKQPTDDLRQKLINEMGAEKQINAKQLKIILQYFSYDTSRLKVAKILLRRTQDLSNCKDISYLFTFIDNGYAYDRYLKNISLARNCQLLCPMTYIFEYLADY